MTTQQGHDDDDDEGDFCVFEWIQEQCKQNSRISIEQGWKYLVRYGFQVVEQMLNASAQSSREKQIPQPFSTQRLTALYTLSYKLYEQHQHSSEVIDGIVNRIMDRLQMYLNQLPYPLEKPVEQDQQHLLDVFVRNNELYKIYLKWISRICHSFNEKHASNPIALTSKGLQLFSYHFQEHIQILTAAVLNQMLLLRSSCIDRNIKIQLLQSFMKVVFELGIATRNRKIYAIDELAKLHIDLHFYIQFIEQPLIQSTKDYYSKTVATWIKDYSLFPYLHHVNGLLRSEVAAFSAIFHSSTTKVIENALIETFLNEPYARFFDLTITPVATIDEYFEKGTEEQLQLMYRFYSLIQQQKGIHTIAIAFERLLIRLGQEAFTNLEREMDFIQELVEIRKKYYQIMKAGFQMHRVVQQSFHKAFRCHVNASRKTPMPKVLSDFTDRLLKGGLKVEEDEIEILLREMVFLVEYVDDKDLYFEYAKQALAKRLLSKRALNLDNEITLIKALELQCGRFYTIKLQGMLKDYELAKTQTLEFRQYQQNQRELASLDYEYQVQVITAGVWPSYIEINPILPSRFEAGIKMFDAWFREKHSSRKLAYLYSLGEVLLNYIIPGMSTFQLQVVPIQALLLLQFNEASEKSVPFSELQRRLNVATDVLKRTLHSVSCGTHKILTIEHSQKPSSISDSSSFRLNLNFTANAIKIRIPMASLESCGAKERVEIDRTHLIEAAIVRTMKARRQSDHLALVTEIMKQLGNFKIPQKTIKQRIERLIEREYLRRSEEDPCYYYYVA